MFYLTDEFLDNLIKEDIPLSDVTTEGMGISNKAGKITCFPKEKGMVTGIDIARKLFEKVGLAVSHCGVDGEIYEKGEPVLIATGRAEQIHCVYKVAQNVMEYSSGISNRTYQMRMEAERGNPEIKVAVTRKHFPGGKLISLMAATQAGAIVHRTGLSESILVFDQHRVFAEDMKSSIAKLKLDEPEKKVAIEAGSPEEGLDFVKWGADIIQCEKFSIAEVKHFVKKAKLLNPNLVINCAGGVNATNAYEYASAGVDVLVTSWVYFGRPFDIKMKIEALTDSGR
ncbi:MAG: ModD protein [Burkholderiales bacterium]|nr:ModD protein [Burkholderiales bacterium]